MIGRLVQLLRFQVIRIAWMAHLPPRSGPRPQVAFRPHRLVTVEDARAALGLASDGSEDHLVEDDDS